MTTQVLLDNYRQSPLSYLIMLTVAGFSLAGLLNKKLFFKLILHPQSLIRDKEYYRVLSADWTNADLQHLLLNELMLYVFCTHLEFTLRKLSPAGSLQFLVIYLAGLLFGSAIIIARYYRNYAYATTGTSGSIMGCMFSFMLLDPGYVTFDLPVIGPVKNLYAGLVYIGVLILYQRRKKEGVVNNEFHFYGGIGGILATLALYPVLLTGIRG